MAAVDVLAVVLVVEEWDATHILVAAAVTPVVLVVLLVFVAVQVVAAAVDMVIVGLEAAAGPKDRQIRA